MDWKTTHQPFDEVSIEQNPKKKGHVYWSNLINRETDSANFLGFSWV